jgi:phenylacetate-CoA ligase
LRLGKSVYDIAPVWLQDLMVSAQGLVFNRRRWDASLGRKLLAELGQSQWWDEQSFSEFQSARLREHIRFAAANVPYYAELFSREGIEPHSIQSVEDLQRIPMLEKDALRKRPWDFLRGGRPRRSWNRLFTSGTTGSPMELFSSRESFTRSWSFVFRLRQWGGLDDTVFPRRVQFTGRDIVPDKAIAADGAFWRRNHAGNALLMSTSHLSIESAAAYVDAINRFGPDLIDGYPSAVAIVARAARKLGLTLLRPKCIITSAETLLPEDRVAIESAFRCKVFNQYASSDTSAFISECEHGSLHVNPEFGICEVLDSHGKPAGPGEEGEIVATSFCNREQIFIRYRIGDSAVVGPAGPCPCGRRMPRIEAITGRVDDVLFIPDRGLIGRLDPIFKSLTGIYEAQIIQESLDSVRVKVVADETYDSRAESALVANLRKKIGYSVVVTVEPVREIPRGPNGKFRSVVSLVSLPSTSGAPGV